MDDDKARKFTHHISRAVPFGGFQSNGVRRAPRVTSVNEMPGFPARRKENVIRLLVVEDNLPYLYLIQTAFRICKGPTCWELTLAHDGAQAVALLFKEEQQRVPLPDLILLDWNLPKVNGHEVLERIKDHENLRKIPVLVFSAAADADDVHAAYSRHANGFVSKPNDMERLSEIVKAIEQFWVGAATLPIVTR